VFSRRGAWVAALLALAVPAFAVEEPRAPGLSGKLSLDEALRLFRDLTKLMYEKGAAALLAYLDAQRTFIASNVEYLNDLANCWTAVFQLAQAAGKELRR